MELKELQQMRSELAKAEQDYINARRDKREEVSEVLADMTRQIEKLISTAETLAQSADLVFYYSSGYEGFCVEKTENWSESSRYC